MARPKGNPVERAFVQYVALQPPDRAAFHNMVRGFDAAMGTTTPEAARRGRPPKTREVPPLLAGANAAVEAGL